MMSSRYLDGTRLPWPADWEGIFGRQAPLMMEIGFGGGVFLVELARKRPEANVLGVEIALPSLRKGERKVALAGLSNVRLVYGGGPLVLWTLCRPGSVSGLYINFPDPWPKLPHHHRRLISDQFLHLAATRLRPGSLLYIATDHAAYAKVITACLERSPYFVSRGERPYTTEDRERVRTKYEGIALAAGRTCHYFQWERNAADAPDIFPIPQELPMPHAILQTPMSLPEIVERFEPQQWTAPAAAGAVNVRLADVLYSARYDSLLVETYINEEPIDQRIGLSVRRQAGGELIVSLHEIGFPRPTGGIHAAIMGLALWLVGLHPEGELVKHNLIVGGG
jgi:tRNA (guanine-N7-)-methyltransferase